MRRGAPTAAARLRTTLIAALLAAGAGAWPAGAAAHPAPPVGEGPAGAPVPLHAGLAAPPPPLLLSVAYVPALLTGDAATPGVRPWRGASRHTLPALPRAAARTPVRRTRAQRWFSRRNLEGG
ncbi:MAG: hypothetical protein U5K81_06715 [Trueperaceae bacterium]|nr:hypothetical protein [Trueperaceae bacterium]